LNSSRKIYLAMSIKLLDSDNLIVG
jgi:hypothetical protein